MPQNLSETLGERVKRLREKQLVERPSGEETTMRQEDLAERCGCDKCTISRIECNTQVPGLPLAKVLAKALGVTTDYLAECV